MPAMSNYQRSYPATALQSNPWMHQAAAQYIVQPHHMAQMIPASAGLDPNTLHFSTIMPQLTAQMSQIQLSQVSGASVSYWKNYNESWFLFPQFFILTFYKHMLIEHNVKRPSFLFPFGFYSHFLPNNSWE